MGYSPTSIIIISIVLPCLALIAVCLRIWVRIKVAPTHLGPDDWLAVAAVVFALADGANLVVGATVGFSGRNFPGEIPMDRYRAENKSEYAQVIIEKPLYALMKLSALFFFRRIFYVHRRFRQMTTAIIVFIVVWAVTFILLEAFACGTQPYHLWTPGDIRQGCLSTTHVNLSFGVTDTVTDILVIMLPYPQIRKLHIRLREKLGLTAIFLLGTLSTAASIVRLVFVAMETPKDFSGAGNRHGAETPTDVWSMVEGSVGVLAACLPPLAPLLRGQFRPPAKTKTTNNFSATVGTGAGPRSEKDQRQAQGSIPHRADRELDEEEEEEGSDGSRKPFAPAQAPVRVTPSIATSQERQLPGGVSQEEERRRISGYLNLFRRLSDGPLGGGLRR